MHVSCRVHDTRGHVCKKNKTSFANNERDWDLSPGLQELMQSSILAKSVSLGAALRRVLDGFHSQKNQARVDALLLRLYEPVIFRGMNAPNNAVRQNAFLLFFDAFPLEVRPYFHTNSSILQRSSWEKCLAVGDTGFRVQHFCQNFHRIWQLFSGPD